jgi:hypothetical protein
MILIEYITCGAIKFGLAPACGTFFIALGLAIHAYGMPRNPPAVAMAVAKAICYGFPVVFIDSIGWVVDAFGKSQRAGLLISGIIAMVFILFFVLINCLTSSAETTHRTSDQKTV